MNDNEKGFWGFTTAQWRLFIVVLVIGLSGFFYHFLRHHNIDHSAALYVGLPFLFALGLSLTPKAKSTMGITMKGMTIALLLSAPVLMEGFICILMASPILYSIAALFAYFVGRAKRNSDAKSKMQLSALSVILVLASLEGTHETLTFKRDNQVEYTRVINENVETIRGRLALSLIPQEPRPLFLKVFPLPINMKGEGLSLGDERKLDFVYKKWIFANEHKGSTIFRVAESKSHYIRFDIPHDDSYISNYLTWNASEVFLEPIDSGKTKITWRLSFDRKLDPAWYFNPMQNYAVWLTAKVLVNNIASNDA